MSFLFPLLLTGGLAVALPIVLHMIRQRTQQRVPFSSLMFLRPALPRLKHRRRLENRLLLLLRCLVVLLLALAFARPFFAKALPPTVVRVGRRIVLLVDTSASMRRTGLWDQVSPMVRSVLADTTALDRVCVMHFDRNLESILSFEEWEGLGRDQRVSVTLARIDELSPGWHDTDLGQALVGAAEVLEDDEVNNRQSGGGARQVVLISDLQQGCEVQALHAYDWPAGMELMVKSLSCEGSTNAAPQWVQDRSHSVDATEKETLRVRVTNAAAAQSEQFQLTWSGASAPGTAVYVVPGHSAVVSVPNQSTSAPVDQLVLKGDDHDFDNTLYIAPQVRQQVTILYLGRDDPNDPEAMLYYVKRAFGRHGLYDFQVVARSGHDAIPDADIQAAHLILVADTVSRETLTALGTYLTSGRTVLLALTSVEQATVLTGLSRDNAFSVQEAHVDDYAMLEHLDVTDPLLRPFAVPQFSDFTQVHIWHYRQVTIPDEAGARVLAWLDTDDPAWFTLNVDQGQLVTMSCGWQPQDSDLALSSKFVPLIYSILESGGLSIGQGLQYFVGDSVLLAPGNASRTIVVRKPDQTVVSVASGQSRFMQTDQPGIYRVESALRSYSFAVNLAARESNTALMPVDTLEQLGVIVTGSFGEGGVPTEQVRQARGWAVQEQEQKIWRWVLLAVWMVLLMEIALSAWLTQPGLQQE
jgi:hypothetical protein